MSFNLKEQKYVFVILKFYPTFVFIRISLIKTNANIVLFCMKKMTKSEISKSLSENIKLNKNINYLVNAYTYCINISEGEISRVAIESGNYYLFVSHKEAVHLSISHSGGDISFTCTGSILIHSSIDTFIKVPKLSQVDIYIGLFCDKCLPSFLLPACPIGTNDVKVFEKPNDSILEFHLDEIADSNKNTPLYSLKISHKINEIFLRYLELLDIANKGHISGIPESQIKSIEKAKKIIEADLSKNHTIQQLAKLSGTNEQYLKKNFKAFYGKTVQKHATDIKMAYAKELIKTQDLKMAEIASKVGYKHATHFTAAFKKYFGFVPQKLK